MPSLLLFLACFLSTLALAFSPEDLRLHQIHWKGTHNSYHLQSKISWDKSHRYSHLTLTEQLERRGIRAFELDVHRAQNTRDLLVYHIAGIDAKSSCQRFLDCLQELNQWSDRNPNHLPLFIWIEIKDFAGGPKFSNFDQVDEEIRRVIGSKLLSPDVVQGEFPSLSEAIQIQGWPRLSEARGKFLFMLDSDPRIADLYLVNQGLRGRVMFPYADAEQIDQSWAVVTKTDPGPFHQQTMQKNFLIASNLCSRERSGQECKSRLQQALAAGTQILMDDFEGDSPAQSHESYFLELPMQAIASCNFAIAAELCFSLPRPSLE